MSVNLIYNIPFDGCHNVYASLNYRFSDYLYSFIKTSDINN